MAKFLPVIGELFTAVESGAKLVGAAAVLPFSTEKASELLEGAGRAWVDYSEQNVIAAPINMGVRTAVGDEEGTDKVKKKLGQSFESFVDGTPVVGHVKGAVHYTLGDREHGDKCMKQASRAAATIVVAVGTGILTGGAGTVATVVATTTASTAAGVGMDLVTTGVDSAVHMERDADGKLHIPFRPAGVVEGVATAYETGDINDIFDSAISIGGEVAVGLAAHSLGKAVGKVTKKVMNKVGRKGKARARAYGSGMRSKSDVKAYAQLEKVVGEAGAKQSVELAKHIERGKYDKHTTITASSVKDGTDIHIGVNRRARQNARVVKKELRGVHNECTNASRMKQLQKKSTDLKKHGSNMKAVKKKSVFEGQSQKSNSKLMKMSNKKFKSAPQQTPKLPIDRDPQVCAEHAAYKSYCLKQPEGNPNSTTLVSVRRQRGKAPQYTTIERCDNCKVYSDVMGDCKTDVPKTMVPLGELDPDPPLTLRQRAHVCVGESAALRNNVAKVAEFGTQSAVLAITSGRACNQKKNLPATQESYN